MHRRSAVLGLVRHKGPVTSRACLHRGPGVGEEERRHPDEEAQAAHRHRRRDGREPLGRGAAIDMMMTERGGRLAGAAKTGRPCPPHVASQQPAVGRVLLRGDRPGHRQCPETPYRMRCRRRHESRPAASTSSAAQPKATTAPHAVPASCSPSTRGWSWPCGAPRYGGLCAALRAPTGRSSLRSGRCPGHRRRPSCWIEPSRAPPAPHAPPS